MKFKFLAIASLVLITTSCKENTKETKVEIEETIEEQIVEIKEVNPFTASIEQAHNKEAFNNAQAISYDFSVSFGGNNRLTATITQLTDFSKIRIDKKTWTSIIYDGNEVFVNSRNDDYKGARFDIFTWPYFISLPYKLNDNGTQWSNEKKNKWGDAQFDSAKLSFDSGIGDTPDDWYVVYKNPETNVLEGAAYIVSFGKDLEKAESDPHAIKYSNFVEVNGVPFATKWTFHNWNEKDGYTDQIGEATIENIEFITVKDDVFKKSSISQVIENPNK